MDVATYAATLEVESQNKKNENTPARDPSTGMATRFKERNAVELSDHRSCNKSAEPHIAEIHRGRPHPSLETHGPNDLRPSKLINEDDLEASPPSTPNCDQDMHIQPSWSYPSKNKWRVLAACITYFGNGLNDSAPGALIPYLESWYDIGYAIVSLIFIANAGGFILAAFFADPLVVRLGRSKLLMLSEVCLIAGYVIIACSPPFPAVVVAYLILGFGNAINLAMNNVFCANLANSTVILGAAHGSYGIGGVVGPIVATSLVANGIPWARFYLIPIGVRICCLLAAGWSFHGYEREPTTQAQHHLSTSTSGTARAGTTDGEFHLLGRALRNKTTIIGAIFIFVYQGAEVAESGWFITYLINDRHGDPAKVGYVTSGFWAGITVGRFVLVHAAHRVGEKRFVFVMGLGCIIFQIIAWQVPSVIGDAGKSCFFHYNTLATSSFATRS